MHKLDNLLPILLANLAVKILNFIFVILTIIALILFIYDNNSINDYQYLYASAALYLFIGSSLILSIGLYALFKLGVLLIRAYCPLPTDDMGCNERGVYKLIGFLTIIYFAGYIVQDSNERLDLHSSLSVVVYHNVVYKGAIGIGVGVGLPIGDLISS